LSLKILGTEIFITDRQQTEARKLFYAYLTRCMPVA